jgi:hypothetical protein
VKHAMLSHITRAETSRVASLQQLAAAGITPVIVESTAPPVAHTAPEVRRRGYDALKVAAGDPDGLVFYEDDILVNPERFHKHLALAVEAGVTTTFCATKPRLYPPGVLNQPSLRVSLVPVPNYAENRGWFGSHAVYLPASLVQYGLDHPEQFMRPDGSPLSDPVIPPDHAREKVTGFDFWIKHTVQQFGGLLVAIPNSVDHDDRGSVRLRGTRPPWTSPTFHTPEARDAA